MKKILFLLDYYLENASPNGICCQRLAKDLVNAGYHVSVVSYRPINAKDVELVDGVKVYKSYEYTEDDITRKKNVLTKIFEYIKWINPFSKYPVYRNRKITNSIYNVASQIIEENDIDTVVAVHLPVDTMIASLKLKEKYTNISFYAYMLDSLSGGIIPRFLPEKFLRWKRICWEDRLMTCYKKIILMESSQYHHKKVSVNKEWYNRATYLNIPLFDCPSAYNHKNELPESVHIAFLGTMGEGIRTPYEFLNILSYIKNLNITVSFTGINRCRRKISDKIGDNIDITINEPVSHKDATRIIDQADIVLNLGNENPYLVPSKIFEYMSHGKPIISTYSIDDDVCISHLMNYPLALLVDVRKPPEDEAQKIIDFINNRLNCDIDFNGLEEKFYTCTPKAFRETL